MKAVQLEKKKLRKHISNQCGLEPLMGKGYKEKVPENRDLY